MSGRAYAEVIGDPIGHSRSPAIHGFWLARLGLDADYRATRVPRDDLASYFRARGEDPAWRGCNITIPHKQDSVALVDALEDDGIGAINCVVAKDGRLVGRNTDAGGFESALPAWLSAGDRVVLIGAGGGAAAALAALARRGIECDIVARNPDQGRELIARFAATGRAISFDDADRALAGAAGVVNASPLGMNGFAPMPASVLAALGRVRPGGFAFDMVYAPLRTALLAAGEQAGLEPIDGLAMLIGQAALAFGFFFGSPAPRGDDDALRAILTR